jgi:long-chain acyl-CoA synthetase
LKHVELKTLFVNDSAVKALKKTTDLASLKFIISFDPIDADSIKYFEDKGIKLISYSDLLAKGKENLLDFNEARFKVEPTDCLTFSYTSGTTGPPKGAMMSHRNFASFCGAVAFNKDTGFNQNDVALSYLPLPHVLEREFLFSMFYAGGCVVYYSGDTAKLKDDLTLVQPTIFVSVPRLFSRFYDVLKAKFKEVQGYTKTALDYAVSTKLSNVQSSGRFTHKIYDPIFFNKTKQALGGRCRLMISGSAPLLPDVQNFLKICMCCPLLEGYGQTENTGAAFITDGGDPITRQVGGPVVIFYIISVEF